MKEQITSGTYVVISGRKLGLSLGICMSIFWLGNVYDDVAHSGTTSTTRTDTATTLHSLYARANGTRLAMVYVSGPSRRLF